MSLQMAFILHENTRKKTIQKYLKRRQSQTLFCLRLDWLISYISPGGKAHEVAQIIFCKISTPLSMTLSDKWK